MSTYRNALPQLNEDVFLTDGGIETTLMFHEGYELPYFASFVLLETERGVESLRSYYRTYADIAADAETGFVLESPTWRASGDWGDKLGYDPAALDDANRRSIALLESVRLEYRDRGIPMVISGNIGPRGDGYVAGERMSVGRAAEYHSRQIEVFAASNADLVSAVTLTYADEAAGIVCAAKAQGMPSVISFTTETDGLLPSGQTLKNAIEQVDSATEGGPDYYMVNCAHADHFSGALEDGEAWVKRIRGVRANASRCSHAELDEAEELDDGDPQEFGLLYRKLRRRFPNLTVLGGCCGTDHRHIESIQIVA